MALEPVPQRIDFLVSMTIEPKEDVTIEGEEPGLPDRAALASYLESNLADQTKHDGGIGWRIITVVC
jgi:hypothetical protein